MQWYMRITGLVLIFLPYATVGKEIISFLIHPTINEEKINSSITLTCAAYYLKDQKFRSDPNIIWYFIPENDTTSTPILLTRNTRLFSGRLMFDIPEDSNNSTLHLIDASREYNGKYYCVAYKDELWAQSKMASYVYGGNYLAVLIVQPQFKEQFQSSTEYLTCKTSNLLKQPPDIQWYYNPNNKTIYNIGNNEYNLYGLNFFTITKETYQSVLELVYASYDYDGEFYCKVRYEGNKHTSSKSAVYRYEAGQDTSKYPFSVAIGVKRGFSQPQWMTNDHSGPWKEDGQLQPIAFVCQVTSFKKDELLNLKYKWIYRGYCTDCPQNTIESNDKYTIEESQNKSYLQLQYSSPDYDGKYLCVVYGITDHDQPVYSVSKEYGYMFTGLRIAPQLVVEPEFHVDKTTKLVESGYTMNLTCKVTQPEFFPPASITWYRGTTGGDQTDLSRPIFKLNPTEETFQKNYALNKDNSVLTFLTYSSFHNGTYHCEAENSVGKVVSKEVLYQYGDYIKITETVDSENRHIFLCDYSKVKTENNYTVNWYFESSTGNFTLVSNETNTITNDEDNAILGLRFDHVELKDSGRYKCLFVNIEKDKWAYNFYNLSTCSMTVSTPDPNNVVVNGHPITLNCSCIINQTETTQFLFFKDRLSDSDKDLLEMYQNDPINLDRFEFTENDFGAVLKIPFARQQDAGTYQCGFQMSPASGRKFINDKAVITYNGTNMEIKGNPFGFGSINITVGIWQMFEEEVTDTGQKIVIKQDLSRGDNFRIFTQPRFLDKNILTYTLQLRDSMVGFLKLGSYGSVSCSSPSYFPDENAFAPGFCLLMMNTGELEIAGEAAVYPPPVDKLTIDVKYELINKSIPLPEDYPSTIQTNLIYPDYNEEVLTPTARYTILSMGFNEFNHQPFYLSCKHCTVHEKYTKYETHCPWGAKMEMKWTFEEYEGYKDNFKMVDNKIEITKIDKKLGQQFNCRVSYTDKKLHQPHTETASQDVIVEGKEPLRLESGVELPLRGIVNEPMKLTVYLDITMRPSLYKDLVTVKWGERGTENGNVTWCPANKSLQLNNWSEQRLVYKVVKINKNTTYVCSVKYLTRDIYVDIPVALFLRPPATKDLKGSVNKSTLEFSWEPAVNLPNNYFIGYEISATQWSRDEGFPSISEIVSPGKTSRLPHISIPDAKAYSYYQVSVCNVYEVGKSAPVSVSKDTPESAPDPPRLIYLKDDQDLKDGTYSFSMDINPPSVPKGEILGYKISLVATNDSQWAEDNMTSRKKREANKVEWSNIVNKYTTAGKLDGRFGSDGRFSGKLEYRIDSGFENITYIYVYGRTSKGYGRPKIETFKVFEQLFAKPSNVWIAIVATISVLFIICAGIFVFYYIKRKKQVKKIIKTQYNPLYPLMRSVVPDQFEINPADLVTSKTLGEGAFGRVMKGSLTKDGNTIFVAVKMLKEESCGEQDAEALWKEIALMKKVGTHPYIVNIIGCVTVKTPICLLVEFVANGDLQSFLREIRAKFEKNYSRNMRSISSQISKKSSTLQSGMSLQSHGTLDSDPLLNARGSTSSHGNHGNQDDDNQDEYVNLSPDAKSPPDNSYINLQNVDQEEKEEILTSNNMLNMMYQTACGMQYLTYKNIIHRDLAARNILVGADMNVKVSDFGLARDMYLEGQYMMNPRGRVPFKWMSPEALFDLKFTSKSDVWSYGVLLWEIVTLGGSPYPGIEPAKLYKLLKNGYRMSRPDGCSLEIYDIMKDCWQEDPDLRPPFDDLAQTIQKLLKHDTADYLTVGQAITSVIQESDEEEQNAIEIMPADDEVEIQEAEPYLNIVSPKRTISSSSSSNEDEDVGPKSPLISPKRPSSYTVLDIPSGHGPTLRQDTLTFPTTSMRPNNHYSESRL